jgi:hypothetical protein
MKSLENQIGKRLMVKVIRRSPKRTTTLLYQLVVVGEAEIHVMVLPAVVWAVTQDMAGVEMLRQEDVIHQAVGVVVV